MKEENKNFASFSSFFLLDIVFFPALITRKINKMSAVKKTSKRKEKER